VRSLALSLCVVLAAACTVLVAGCTGSSAPPHLAPPAGGGSYPNARALLHALAVAGIPCTGASVLAQPTASGATSMADCGSPASPGDTVVAVFRNHADAQSFAIRLTALGSEGLMGPVMVVVGQNWAVNTVLDYGTKVQVALGGQALPAPAPSSPAGFSAPAG
jgi:hypothetical protein